ncbi:MAG TPA: tetratricopeptide repeat protein [Candidatus Brocadiia bacterium]|nr:tetratricopeptide repeat protein [Candidatus Brocadiales bacterium]
MRSNSLATILIMMGLMTLPARPGGNAAPLPQPAHSGVDGLAGVESEILSITTEPTDYGVVLYTVTVSRSTVLEFLKTLSNVCSMKLTVDDDVDTSILSSYVTVYLEKAPLEDILEIVLGSKGLEHIIKNDEVLVTFPAKLSFDSALEYLKEKAVQLYQKAQIKYPNCPLLTKAYFDLGNYYFNTGSHLLAIQEFQTIVDTYPNDELTRLALINIAKCYEKLSDFENARYFYFRFIDTYRRDELLGEVYLSIGDTWYIQGEYSKAISIYKKILDAFSGDNPEILVLAHLQLSRSYQRLGDFKEALDAFLVMKKKYPSEKYRSEVEYQIGNCMYQIGNYEEAAGVFGNLIVTEPTNPMADDAFCRFADCSYMQGDYFGAIQAYKGFLASFPDSKLAPRAHYYMGKCFQRLQVYNAAIKVFLEGLKKYSTSPYRKAMEFDMGLAFLEKEDFRHAYEIFMQYTVDGSDKHSLVEANFYVAECLFNENKYNEALSAYNKMLALDLAIGEMYQGRIYKRIGDCYKELGQIDKSILAYQGKVQQPGL